LIDLIGLNVKNILNNNRGIALILVILMISVIVALTLQLNVSSRAQIYESANLGDGIKVLYIAKSGIYGGAAVLSQDDNSFDSLNENWAKIEGQSEQSRRLFTEGYFKLHIEDESGKIQINRLVSGNEYNPAVKGLLTRLLSLPEFKLSSAEIGEIIDSIKDWLDQDDIVTGSGAESAYYQHLDRSYSTKNGLVESLEEILLIKGITKDIFYGKDGRPGLAGFLTLNGSGRIDINTAPKMVLRALASGITEEMVENMDNYRKDSGNNLADPIWYQKVTGMTGITIDPNLIATSSDVFSITSTGYVGNMKRSITAIVQRDKDKNIKILSWKIG
jgi:general secretion pathway protein K